MNDTLMQGPDHHLISFLLYVYAVMESNTSVALEAELDIIFFAYWHDNDSDNFITHEKSLGSLLLVTVITLSNSNFC